jgi:HEPN domain-containing protein
MKEKADLTVGWLRKATSDIVSMEASRAAGALDAACFHAQQAAEKYLKAFLTERGLAFPYTHNLAKLISICVEQDASFAELLPDADLLTPYAVEVRYDFEFWPTRPDADRALQATSRVRDFVEGRFAKRWSYARAAFDWKADLRKFCDRQKFEGFFDREITPSSLGEFEQVFRDSLSTSELRRAGEVCFWKNFRRNRDELTRQLLGHLEPAENWVAFVDRLKKLSSNPTFDNFGAFRRACAEEHGFATPITFLAFYDPDRFPMIDRYIGDWCADNAERFQLCQTHRFARRKDGLIRGSEASWKAYLAWTEFCRRTAKRLAELTRQSWRARDVEMAVWTAQTKSLFLPPLTLQHSGG